MNLRFAGMIAGCMLIGASAAAYHRTDGRPAPSGATLAAATSEAPASAAWPPAASIAFYEEMFEQLPAATAPVTPAQAETPPPPAAAPQRVASLPSAPHALPSTPQALPTPNASAGMPQTSPARIDRRRLAGARGYPPPPPYRIHHSYAHGPDGGPLPRGGRGHHGPYGLYR